MAVGRQSVRASADKQTPVNLAADVVAGFDALYVGVTGNIKVDSPTGDIGVLYSNVPVGILPIACAKVYSTANGTTASGIVGLNW